MSNMESWRYQAVSKSDAIGPYVEIKEVYVDCDGKIVAYSDKPVPLLFDSSGVEEEYGHVIEALSEILSDVETYGVISEKSLPDDGKLDLRSTTWQPSNDT